MVDAKTTHRWYFVVAMGRKAGHLALGIGKAAGTTLTLIPEEFRGPVRLRTIVDILAGAIIKRIAYGRQDGVAVLAEGLIELLPKEDLAELAGVERDEHDNIRMAEINIGDIVKAAVSRRLGRFGVKMTIVAKNIGYEVRCADPIPLDMEYTRDLGFSAARHVIEGGTAALISIQSGRFKPVPFVDIMDPKTGRMRVRMVDIESDRFKIARNYMLRLNRSDFDDANALGRIAAAVKLAPDELRAELEHVVTDGS
jgi:ATP-dependent phosphofructokinase / diphosphate-dependent phosphofructokinase